MKKYLIKGLLALFGGIFLVSCTDHDVDYIPLTEQKTQAFNEAFKEMIGGDVDPNQDWGFTGVSLDVEDENSPFRASTRTPQSGGWEITGDYAESFSQETMLKIMGALPEGVNATNKLNNYEFVSKGTFDFCVVYSVTSAADKIGYYYYDPNKDPNEDGSAKKPYYGEFVNNIQNNGFFQYDFSDGSGFQNPTINPNPNGKDDNTFNTPDELGNKYCGQCKNTKRFYQWTCEHIMYHFSNAKVKAKKLTVNIPVGWRMGFYIINGNDRFFSDKSRNADGYFYSAVATLDDGSYAVGLEDWLAATGGDFDCNDIVMYIKKENKPDIYNFDEQNVTSKSKQRKKLWRLLAQGRMFCEDLGTAGLKDLDFNDIVFDARIWETQEFDEVVVDNGGTQEKQYPWWGDVHYELDLCMLAAGGTIDAKLLYNYNVHYDLFDGNPGKTTLVNTMDDHAHITVTWENSSANPGSKTHHFDITELITSLKEAAKPDKHTVTLNDIPISVLWASADDPSKLGNTMQTVGTLHATPGEVPHKFCLPIGTRWPSERIPFIYAYPDFGKWSLNKNDAPKFWTNVKTDSLYNDKGNSDGLSLTDPYGHAYANSDEDLNKVFYSNIGDPKITQKVETISHVWASNPGLYLGDYNNQNHDNFGPDIFDNIPTGVKGATIRFYGTPSDPNNWGIKFFDGKWNPVTELTNNNSTLVNGEYVEYPLSDSLLETLKKDDNYGSAIILQGNRFTLTSIAVYYYILVEN